VISWIRRQKGIEIVADRGKRKGEEPFRFEKNKKKVCSEKKKKNLG